VTTITELLRFRNKSILTVDLNAKHPVCNSKASNTSDLKFLELVVSSNFEILTPQCSTHYTADGRSDVFDIVVHQGNRLSLISRTRITFKLYLLFWSMLERGSFRFS
jgi:hypothetical protein